MKKLIVSFRLESTYGGTLIHAHALRIQPWTVVAATSNLERDCLCSLLAQYCDNYCDSYYFNNMSNWACIIMLLGVNTFTIYDARLGSGSATYSGRVEVLTSLGWLPVCSRYTSSWGPEESGVLCRQLGYHNHLSYSERYV